MNFLKTCEKYLKEDAEDFPMIKIGGKIGDTPESESETDDIEDNGETGEDEDDEKQYISGGKADQMTVEDIATKLGLDVDEVEEAIAKGAKVEMEHTSDIDVARSIASDHVLEFFDYYIALAEMEKELKSKVKKNVPSAKSKFPAKAKKDDEKEEKE